MSISFEQLSSTLRSAVDSREGTRTLSTRGGGYVLPQGESRVTREVGLCNTYGREGALAARTTRLQGAPQELSQKGYRMHCVPMTFT